ncbi:MAG: hypothetical protein F6J87_08195 [Spirulina sp. SIO3F2]|nr:hypothetical protein [Spirulina sp. SIO3F2]
MGIAIVLVLGGSLLGLVFVAIIRQATQELNILATSLFLAALIYLGFAIWYQVPTIWLQVELLGMGCYGTVALWGGWQQSKIILMIGWLLHPVWDVVLPTYII